MSESSSPNVPDPSDPWLWLEDVFAEPSLVWVREQNSATMSALSADPNFAEIERRSREILEAPDRIPVGTLDGPWVWNFWQDSTHVRGLWRRIGLERYGKSEDWEVLLDLDALAAAEGENWVWQTGVCLAPAYERCLIRLSRGGSDAAVVREFDIPSKSFVPAARGGFVLPEGKQNVTWIDRETLLLGRDFGPGTMTSSGYPATARLWRRGQPWQESREVFAGAQTDVLVGHDRLSKRPGSPVLISRAKTFWTDEKFVLDPARPMELTKVNLPESAQVEGLLPQGRLLVRIMEPMNMEPVNEVQATSAGEELPAGSVITTRLDGSSPEVVARSSREFAISNARVAAGGVMVESLAQVQSKLVFALQDSSGAWSSRPVATPPLGTGTVLGAHEEGGAFLLHWQSFLTPPSLLVGDLGTTELETRYAQRAAFDPSGMHAEQRFATSPDGTSVPYFVVGRREVLARGGPALLYGYGGFRISMLPSWQAVMGKNWLEAGGIYVLANIRGGGEFGPDWHQAAILRNKHKSHDDFIAVAEELIRSGLTTPSQLAIQGGSNGGLLVGAVAMRRPDLFALVLCQVPLLDMMRYHLLLAGASWMGEYGNPDDPEMAAYLRTWSPYQNIKSDVTYPKMFFYTSTRDDRVHPGHARKMAAAMKALGHDVWYYENIEGGHGGAANLEQRARKAALETVALLKTLSPSTTGLTSR